MKHELLISRSNASHAADTSLMRSWCKFASVEAQAKSQARVQVTNTACDIFDVGDKVIASPYPTKMTTSLPRSCMVQRSMEKAIDSAA